MTKSNAARFVRIGLLALLSASCCSFARPDSPSTVPSSSDRNRSEDPKHQPGIEQEVARRRDEIKKEIESLGDHAWAGEYYFGDGLGVNVSFALAPKSGFAFTWHGCLGLYDLNYGDVSVDADGYVNLNCTFENRQEGFQGIATRMYPMRWGERHYLIPENEFASFCNSYNSQWEPRRNMHGMYALKRGDENKPVEGKPMLPWKWQAHLIDDEVKADVIEVGPGGRKLTLNIGSKEGAFKGMEMWVRDPETCMLVVTIREVDEHTSSAVVTLNAQEQLPPDPIKWKLSTRAH